MSKFDGFATNGFIVCTNFTDKEGPINNLLKN